MKITLILALCLMFIASCFNSAYEAKAGVPKKNQ